MAHRLRWAAAVVMLAAGGCASRHTAASAPSETTRSTVAASTPTTTVAVDPMQAYFAALERLDPTGLGAQARSGDQFISGEGLNVCLQLNEGESPDQVQAAFDETLVPPYTDGQISDLVSSAVTVLCPLEKGSPEVTPAAATPATTVPATTVLAPTGGNPSLVLGRTWGPYQEGYGTTQPPTIDNGGDPTGLVRDITWTSWGGSRATGTGTSVYVPDGGSVAGGSTETATVVAFDPGTCDGVTAYRAVEWYFAGEGQQFNPGQYINICTGTYVGQ